MESLGLYRLLNVFVYAVAMVTVLCFIFIIYIHVAMYVAMYLCVYKLSSLYFLWVICLVIYLYKICKAGKLFIGCCCLRYIGLIRNSQQTLAEGTLVTRETTKQLRKLLFGSSKGYFNAEWVGQNFIFSTTPGLEYGLVQHKVSCLSDIANIDTHK